MSNQLQSLDFRLPKWSDRSALLIALLWIPGALWADRTVSTAGQLWLGALTWFLLIWWLRHESPMVRAQTMVVVLLATIVEYVFSGWLGIYVYRLDHVPAYVPPGHGLVYLAALTIGRLAIVRRHARIAVTFTVVAAGLWALWGMTLSGRPDVLGVFWYLCLLGFLAWGRARLLYVGAFLVVSYLELLGTRWGVWAWQPYDTVRGWVSMGNPPAAAAGGYGWFDLYATLLAPGVLLVWSRAARHLPRRRNAVTDVAPCQPASIRNTSACSNPLVETPLPRSGPSTPSSPVNRPPASVTTSDTPATS